MNKALSMFVLLIVAGWAAAQFRSLDLGDIERHGDLWLTATRWGVDLRWSAHDNVSSFLSGGSRFFALVGSAVGRPHLPRLYVAGGGAEVFLPYWLAVLVPAVPLIWRLARRRRRRSRGFAVKPAG